MFYTLPVGPLPSEPRGVFTALGRNTSTTGYVGLFISQSHAVLEYINAPDEEKNKKCCMQPVSLAVHPVVGPECAVLGLVCEYSTALVSFMMVSGMQHLVI